MLASDYELYSRASVIVETAGKLSSDGDDGTHQQYLLWSERSTRFLIAGTTRL